MSSTNDGLENLGLLVGGIGDGCVANFATQIKRCADQSLLKDEVTQVLHAFFQEKIVTKIFNEGVDHLGGSAKGNDYFTNPDVVDKFISPEGLVAGILDVMTKDHVKSTRIIKDGCGSSENIMIEKLQAQEIEPEEVAVYFGKLATYLIIKPLLVKIPNMSKNIKELEEEFSKVFGIQTPDTSPAGQIATNLDSKTKEVSNASL